MFLDNKYIKSIMRSRLLKYIYMHISVSYYYYFNLYTLLTETSGIGSAPPFPLHGNVVSIDENFENALGYFQVRSTTEKEITITD